MTIIFFNPYADNKVKGASRRIEFLQHLLDSRGIPNFAILSREYARAQKSTFERFVLFIGMKRFAYFLHAWSLCRKPGYTVISEVIFTPVWLKDMVLTVHDLKVYNSCAARGGRLRRFAYGLFTRLAGRIVVVSESVRSDLLSMCKVAPERICVVPNGISHERLAMAKAAMGRAIRYDFVYVSSFVKHKRHDLLLRAAPAGSRICLIGNDLGTLDEIRLVARRRGDEIQVDILDDVDTDSQLFELLGASRCGVFPSVFEGFGIPLLEYNAVGLYVIASDIPPFRELAAYVNRFVAPDDEEDLRAALTDALARPLGALHDAAERVARSSYTDTMISIRLAHLLGISFSNIASGEEQIY